MNTQELQAILEKHEKWLKDEEGGERANLSDANLRCANLSDANLSDANLSDANLSDANLSDANLSGADLRCANLSDANLSDANLSDANLSDADLRCADLSDADLRCANLRCANLRCANLRCADLSDADLSDANLSGANLSGAKGLLSPAEWMDQHFKKTADGWLVYKAIGDTSYSLCRDWDIKEGAVLCEVANPSRNDNCGCGVNYGTPSYIQRRYPPHSGRVVWECLIEWRDGPSIVVPYGTDGKARCERLTLLRALSVEEFKALLKEDKPQTGGEG